MLKKTLIAAATAVALAGTVVATTAPASAASANPIEVAGNGWNGHGGNWNGRGGRHGNKQWAPRRACQPIVRWKKVGYRYHRRWQPVVVGWDCHHGRGGGRGHHKGKWH